MTFTKWVMALGIGVAMGRAESVPLKIDRDQSHIEIGVKATVDSFTGTLDEYDVAVKVDPETETVTDAKVAFHFADVKTGKADRDQAMNEWQETEAHPDGSFTLTTLNREAGGKLKAAGTLKLHGEEKAIEFPASVTHEGALYAIDGDAALDTRDFGLPIIRKFLMLKVDPVVHVRFHIQGIAGK